MPSHVRHAGGAPVALVLETKAEPFVVRRPAGSALYGGPIAWLREIVHWRDLLFMLAWREIKLKYKQSVMGFMWAILMPAIIITAGVLVKYIFASVSGAPLKGSEVVNVAVRSVPWAFVVASIRFGSASLLANSNLVTKIYMPRVLFPFASVLSQLVDLAVASVVLSVLLLFSGGYLGVQLLWLPVLLAIMIVLVSGIVLFASAAALILRDVKYIVEVVLTFAIFFTPVFYDVSVFGERGHLLLLNPVAPLLEGMSSAVAGRPLAFGLWVLYSAVVATLALIGGLAFFKRLEPYFAESA